MGSHVALRLSPCDVTQQATWQPPCGVRRVIQKRSQLYTKKSNVSRNLLYGFSMSSSPNLNILLLWVFFSFKKTKSMVFATKHRLKKLAVQDLAMNNQPLGMVTSYKYLGLTLESCMGFEHHMKNLFKIIGHKVWLLSKLRRYVNLKSAEIIFKTMILPYFDYADIFYEATTVQNLSKLQRLQNGALRIVTQSKATDISTKDLQLSMNVTPLR